jgi:hypothetical protein
MDEIGRRDFGDILITDVHQPLVQIELIGVNRALA